MGTERRTGACMEASAALVTRRARGMGGRRRRRRGDGQRWRRHGAGNVPEPATDAAVVAGLCKPICTPRRGALSACLRHRQHGRSLLPPPPVPPLYTPRARALSMSAAACTMASPALTHTACHHAFAAPRRLSVPPRSFSASLRQGFHRGFSHQLELCGMAHCAVDHPRLVPRIGVEVYGPVVAEDVVAEDVERGARELQDEADFASLANGDGEISICGFGSLLSERSALYTFPNLRNFRVAVLRDFRRVFAHVAPVFLDRGIANIETKELSSLSVEPCMGESIIVTVFEISVAEVSAFIEREHEFRFLAATVEDKAGQPFPQRAVVCARYSDEEYHRIRCRGSSEEYQKRYGKHNIQQIWRDDIFPCRVYLRHCVLAAKNLGSDAYDSFLDHTYLGDRITTIRKYLEAGLGVDIMDEHPPEALRDRYGG